MRRFQTDQILKDISKKIVFLVGPRQVGKTWLAKEIAGKFSHSVYLNYDYLKDREIIKDEAWRENTELLILDELHKMPQWKNYLKGLFDTRSPILKIIVTGSARLDFLRQAGDSLAGRFFTHRLLPLSLRELDKTPYSGNIDRLIERGGFPEPFLAEQIFDAQRWRQQYTDGLIRTDILDFEKIHDLRAMQLVLALLQQRIGSPVSFTSIARDVGISPSTVLKYIQILETLYIVFRVPPYAHSIARSLIKEPKIYFFDTGMVEGDAGARFENFMAVSLLKHVYGLVDYRGEAWDLRYLRTKDGREVDFCLVKKGRVDSIVECKVAEKQVSGHLYYFCEKYGLKGVQVLQELKQERKINASIELRRAKDYLEELFL
jgi:uncharacterized protein